MLLLQNSLNDEILPILKCNSLLIESLQYILRLEWSDIEEWWAGIEEWIDNVLEELWEYFDLSPDWEYPYPLDPYDWLPEEKRSNITDGIAFCVIIKLYLEAMISPKDLDTDDRDDEEDENNNDDDTDISST